MYCPLSSRHISDHFCSYVVLVILKSSSSSCSGDTQGWNTFEGNRPDSETFQGEAVSEFLDVRSQRWVIFGRVWNEIIIRLRVIDHLSDNEKDIMLFSTFDWLSKPVYLPLFQTAGCVDTAMYLLKEAATQYLEEREPQKKLMVLDDFNLGETQSSLHWHPFLS